MTVLRIRSGDMQLNMSLSKNSRWLNYRSDHTVKGKRDLGVLGEFIRTLKSKGCWELKADIMSAFGFKGNMMRQQLFSYYGIIF